MAGVESIGSEAVTQAYNRIKGYIPATPLLQNQALNRLLGSNVYFKFEGTHEVGAFKARGALNTLLALKERRGLPTEVATFSAGNHTQAVAWAANLLNIPKTTVFIPASASPLKIEATKRLGAEVILTQDRQEAERLVMEKAKTAFFVPPFDHDDVIAGQGTSALEAWMAEGGFDAVFAPCGGGGLVSGTYLATRLFSSSAPIYAAEPQLANDAAESFRAGAIRRLSGSSLTLADGARTLTISERTFQYIRKLNGFYEISENEIIYWTQWLTYLLKVTIEPTGVLGMAGAFQWIREGNQKKKILIIITGGNMDPTTYVKIWGKSYLSQLPNSDSPLTL